MNYLAPDSVQKTSPSASVMALARQAQANWASQGLGVRLAIIEKFRILAAENGCELAEMSAGTRNRPMSESLAAEVIPLVRACRFLEQRAPELLKAKRYRRSEVHRVPYGVVLVIGPGNYPLFLPGVMVLQALAAGNAVVLKPGADGQPAADALLHYLQRAGLPKGALQVLDDSVEAAQRAIEEHPDKLFFTGSAETGRVILSSLADKLIPAVMELSGCDAMIVREDADLELVIKCLLFGLFLNDGATCIAPRRVFVDQRIAPQLESLLAEALQGRHSCAPVDQLDAAAAIRGYVRDALSCGARLVNGTLREPAVLQMPIVLGGVRPDSAILGANIFAPVLSIVSVAGDEEAVRLANASPFALGASVFTRNVKAGQQMAARIEGGLVTINDLIIPGAHPALPFGGCKSSGFGVTRGEEGLLEMTRPKVITVTRSRFRPELEPTSAKQGELLQSYLQLAYGEGVRSRFTALRSLLGALRKWKGTPE